MKKRFFIVALLMLLLLGGFIGFDMFRKHMMAQYFAGMKPPASPVAVITAELQPVPNTLEGIGSLEAVRQVTVSPEVGGRITEVSFEAGAEVKSGDSLIRLNDDPEQGDLKRYQAQAKLADLNLGRSNKLVDVAAPRSRVDEFRSQLEEARGGIERTQALIAQKAIVAPFDGVLGIRQVNLGQYLNPGQAIVTLTDLSELFVNFTLPEQSRSLLAVGQPVIVTADAWPDRSFDAVINAIEPQVGEETRTIKIQARMPNPDKLLTPGMFARAKVVLPERETQIILPATAVDFTIYGDSVYVVREDGKDDKGGALLKADRVYVKTGRRFDSRVAIASGINPGDRIVTSGQIKLNPGAPVTLAPSDALMEDQKAPANKGNE